MLATRKWSENAAALCRKLSWSSLASRIPHHAAVSPLTVPSSVSVPLPLPLKLVIASEIKRHKLDLYLEKEIIDKNTW